jgi:hypothetical protein
MRALAAALRPGGWLVLEEFDSGFQDALEPDPDDADLTLYMSVLMALSDFLDRSGADTRYARTLPERLAGLGLQDIGAEGRLVFTRGGTPAAGVVKANFIQVGGPMVAQGVASAADVDRAIELLDDPALRFTMPLMISAWGRRPA